MTAYNYEIDDIDFESLEVGDSIILYNGFNITLNTITFYLGLNIMFYILENKKVAVYYGMFDQKEILKHGKRLTDIDAISLIPELEKQGYIIL